MEIIDDTTASSEWIAQPPSSAVALAKAGVRYILSVLIFISLFCYSKHFLQRWLTITMLLQRRR